MTNSTRQVEGLGSTAWQTVDAWIRAAEDLGCAEFAVQNVSDLHRLRDDIAAICPASDLEQVIRERDEAVRLLRELYITRNNGEMDEQIAAFLSSLDNRPAPNTPEKSHEG